MIQSASLDDPKAVANAPISFMNAEAEIRQRLHAHRDAYEQGDLDRLTSLYAPDVVVFDCPPRLRLRGRHEYLQSLKKWSIEAFAFPLTYETREEKIIVNGDLAVVHELANVTGKFKESGVEESAWIRRTIVFEKESGAWLITHEHLSVPVDTELKALMAIDPDHDLDI